ncbi:MAG: hypothetical protein WDM84_07015 [Bauldia sp.]
MLATYTYENVRLLLTSASGVFPGGLANNSGNVGKYFMTHAFPMTLGVFPGRNLHRWGGTAAQAAAVADFDADNFDHSEVGFIGGSVLMAPAENKAIFNALNTPPSVARWGRRMEAVASRKCRLHRLDMDFARRVAIRGQLPRPRSCASGP